MDLPSKSKIGGILLALAGIYIMNRGFSAAQSRALQEQTFLLPIVLAFVGLALAIGGAMWFLWIRTKEKHSSGYSEVDTLDKALKSPTSADDLPKKPEDGE